MQTTEKSISERRTGSFTMVKKMVHTRNNMLTMFNNLANNKPFSDATESTELLAEFCASLIDYTANAHFQLYRHFAEDRERRGDIQDVARRVYPRIVDITQRILDFNDKYDSEEQRRARLNELESDLSSLGEVLAERIELEDELVNTLCHSREGRGSARQTTS